MTHIVVAHFSRRDAHAFVIYNDEDWETLPNYNSDYLCGYRKPRYPVPALIQDSQSDLALRWSNWLDDDRLSGRRY